MYVWNGSVSIQDEDEPFLSGGKDDLTGMVIIRLDQEEFMELLHKLSKVDPDYANKEIVREFYNENVGDCGRCNIEYHSRLKKERCINCGSEVYLT